MVDKLALTPVCINKKPENLLAFTRDCTSTSLIDACSSVSIVTYHIFCHIFTSETIRDNNTFLYNQRDDEFK